MLKVDELKNNIIRIIREIVIPAIEEIELARQPRKSDVGDDKAKQIADEFDELVTVPFADNLANAIDYYVKNAQIFGTVITVGTPVTQQARIESTPVPMINGTIPNTFGIK